MDIANLGGLNDPFADDVPEQVDKPKKGKKKSDVDAIRCSTTPRS